MLNMIEEVVKAKNLLPEDYLMLAGRLYRISLVKKSKKTDQVMVQAYPLSIVPERKITLYMQRKTMCIIYNQAQIQGETDAKTSHTSSLD